MVVSRVFLWGLAASFLSTAALAQAPAADPGVPVAPQANPSSAAPGEPEAAENPLANRAQIPPVLRFLQAQGVKLTTLGTEGGLAAYLGESPNGRMQVFYVGPDGNFLVAGLLFNSDGQNITGIQLGEMQRRFEAAQKQLSAPGTPSVPAGTAVAPEVTAPSTAKVGSSIMVSPPTAKPSAPAPEAAPQKSEVTKPAQSLAERLAGPASPVVQAAPGTPVPATPIKPVIAAPAAPAAPVAPGKQSSLAAPAAHAISEAEKYVSLLDRGAVERSLRETAWFNVGVENAPAIYMVADPQCVFCHAAWARLQTMVMDKKIQLRIVMIAGLKGSQPLAISILSRPQPGEAWLAGEGSTDGVQVLPPPASDKREYLDAARVLDLNAKFVRDFGINQTPTFLYIGKDERLYQTVGLPDDVGGFLAALL